MAEDDVERVADGAGPVAADQLALAGASRAKADAYLDGQIALGRLQRENLVDQNAFELSHLWWRRFNDQLTGALRILLVALGLLIAVGIGAAMWNASQAEGLVVDAFSVPPDYAQAGVAGDFVADDMTAKIAAIRDFANANSLARSDDVSEDRAEEVKVEIPETGVSLAEAWRYLRRWLGHERHLSGNLRSLAGGGIALTVSLGGADTFTFAGKPGDLDMLEERAAERVFASVDPVNIVLYLEAKGRGAEALAAAARNVAAASSTRDLAGGYSLYANLIRETTGDARRSLAMARLAIALDPKGAPQHMEALNTSRTLGHEEEVLAQARAIATLRAVDNIGAWRSGNGFAYVQQLGAIWRAADTGDFAALSTLPCVYLCSHADAAVLQARALARLHDIGAASALIAEALVGPSDPADVAFARYDLDAARGAWRAAAGDARLYADGLAANGVSAGLQNVLARTRVAPLLARALARAGDIDGAQKAVADMPLDCYDCLRARGAVAAARHDERGAVSWYARAAGFAPSLPFADTDGGAVLLQNGDRDGAITKFTAAHRKGPHFADPLELWGEALIAQNRSDLALAKFAEAARYAPHWGRLHLKWGEALGWSGDRAGAAKQFALAGALFLTPAEQAELSRVRRSHG